MGPIKALKKRKRSAEKKADPNVLLAASAATDSLHDDDDDESQPSDWWDGFSRRISGTSKSRFFFCIDISRILTDYCSFSFSLNSSVSM